MVLEDELANERLILPRHGLGPTAHSGCVLLLLFTMSVAALWSLSAITSFSLCSLLLFSYPYG